MLPDEYPEHEHQDQVEAMYNLEMTRVLGTIHVSKKETVRQVKLVGM